MATTSKRLVDVRTNAIVSGSTIVLQHVLSDGNTSLTGYLAVLQQQAYKYEALEKMIRTEVIPRVVDPAKKAVCGVSCSRYASSDPAQNQTPPTSRPPCSMLRQGSSLPRRLSGWEASELYQIDQHREDHQEFPPSNLV
jgi:hypothetical protein